MALAKLKGLVIDESNRLPFIPVSTDLQINNQVVYDVSLSIGAYISSTLGSGSYGTAYLLNNNMVCKVTRDKSEVINALRLVGRRNMYLTDIYGVYRSYDTYDNEPRYIILQEFLQSFRRKQTTLNILASESVSSILTDMNDFTRERKVSDWYGYMCGLKHGRLGPQEKAFEEACLENGKGEFIVNLNGLMAEARTTGVLLEDIHAGNMAFKLNKLSFIDYGGFRVDEHWHELFKIPPIRHYIYPSNFPSPTMSVLESLVMFAKPKVQEPV